MTGVAAWKAGLSEALQCEQLSKSRVSMRKLMLQLYGGHSAYHDAKAHTRLYHAHKVLTQLRMLQCCSDFSGQTLQS